MDRIQSVGITFLLLALSAVAPGQTKELSVDYKKLASRADITVDVAASRSEEGLPIGNGRTGTLVWTSPSALKFQINRVDVFSSNASSVSFPRADSDYGSSCGYVDINLVDAGEDVFAGAKFQQHLSAYDGLVTTRGNGVVTRTFAWHGADVLAVEIDDQRKEPSAVNIDLRMLRYAIQTIYDKSYQLAKNNAVEIHTAEHTATSQLHVRGRRILLTQQYREKEYYNSTAVAIQVLGRKSKARYLNESTVQLSVGPARGTFTILISSASTFDPKSDVAALALKELDSASGMSFDQLKSHNTRWWADFWSKGFVSLHSDDGQADFVEANYTYFLYLMGSTSLGKYPPRFGGLLFNTNGDMRRWGSQYWWANTSAYYRNLLAANRPELLEPMFSMYSGMYGSCAIAARQQWGSKGIWIPEIVAFDGMEELPPDIAQELQDLVLARKRYEERSAKFQWFVETKNRHHARWNFQTDGHWDHGHYVVPTKASFQPGRFISPDVVSGIFGHCTHILGAGARIAQVYWEKYEYTLDKEWLKNEAYPMIKGAAEFYRNFPNLRKEVDGKYHIHHVSDGEGKWNSSNSPYEINTMRMIFPIAVRASEILGVDADLRPLWQEIRDNLVELPERPGRPRSSRGGYGAFVYGGPGAVEPLGSEPELKSMFLNFNRTGGFIDSTGIGGAKIFRNRLRLREGPGAIDAEHIGGLTSGIHQSLLTDTPGSPSEQPVIRVFPSWPKDWDAAFTLRGRAGFVVSSSQRSGETEFVELRSHLGGECRLHNPWGEAGVSLIRDGVGGDVRKGSLLQFPTHKGEHIVIVRSGNDPVRYKRSIPE